MTLTIGALFAGYGGLDLAVMDVLDARLAWYAEFDKAPASIMAHHHPDVPNLWDVTAVDWAAVEPVDVITGGSPCQDLSHAGKRAGMKAGTRSGLWASMCDAIDIIRPRLVVWENVRGALSAGADSAVEPCPICVGDEPGVTLRALGRVLGDLAELGYDARWYGLRAADVGAAHGRFRVFVIAAPAHNANLVGLEPRDPGQSGEAAPGSGPTPIALLPTPHAGLGEKYRANGQPPARRIAQGRQVSVADIACHDFAESFGAYATAIERWSGVMGSQPPAPTEPNANGGRRLSPEFVEWLMGLPTGHVTDVPGITRNEALRALGNGVVPQQAAAALRAYIADERAWREAVAS